jgi:hypothetical protein
MLKKKTQLLCIVKGIFNFTLEVEEEDGILKLRRVWLAVFNPPPMTQCPS